MLRFHAAIHRLCLAVLLALMLAACRAGPTPTPTVVPRPKVELFITPGTCPSRDVNTGDAVMWTNVDKADHQLRAVRDDIVVFQSGIVKPGKTFTFVFKEKGEFPYRCSIDESLTGTISVEP